MSQFPVIKFGERKNRIDLMVDLLNRRTFKSILKRFQLRTYHEKAQQLVMCLRGEAQKLLVDLSAGQRTDYDNLRSILTKRFNPHEL